MATKALYNPSNGAKSSEIISFNGIASLKNEQLDYPYVESCNNLDIKKLREMTPRKGQTVKIRYSSGITGGKKTLSTVTTTAGAKVYISMLRSNLTPTAGINFIRPILLPVVPT